MSNIETMTAKAVKSYLGFEEGTYAARKGRLCFIKKIHFEMHPPSVTVQMMDTDTEVGTEFDRLQHLNSWFCDMCTAENKDVQANKCFFCKLDRSYKEKITVIQPADKATSSSPLQPVPEDEQVEDAPDLDTKTEQETSDSVSEQSKVTDDEYEELADAESTHSDHELSAEDEPECEPEPEPEAEPVAHDPMYAKSKLPQQHWSSYQHEPVMQGQPNRRGRPQRHSQRTQNRKRPAMQNDVLPPPPMGQRRSAPNRRTRSQPSSFWMNDEDTMQFRRPLHSYWPRSWYDWDW